VGENYKFEQREKIVRFSHTVWVKMTFSATEWVKVQSVFVLMKKSFSMVVLAFVT